MGSKNVSWVAESFVHRTSSLSVLVHLSVFCEISKTTKRKSDSVVSGVTSVTSDFCLNRLNGSCGRSAWKEVYLYQAVIRLLANKQEILNEKGKQVMKYRSSVRYDVCLVRRKDISNKMTIENLCFYLCFCRNAVGYFVQNGCCCFYV